MPPEPTPPTPTIAPSVRVEPLPYQHLLEARPLAAVDLVVVHCTELPDLAMARAYGERVLHASGTGNSGHFYIDRDGSVLQYVEPGRTAHHVRSYNPRSIGIELVNTGRYPDWLHSRHQAMDEPYPPLQVQALVDLVLHLRNTVPSLRHIAGHEDLDTERVPASDDPSLYVSRKRDPGPLFPWGHVLPATGLERLAGDARDPAPPPL